MLHEINVIGTLQLLAACERTETLRHVVVRGSAAIYGSEGPAPFFFTEDLARRAPLRTRFQRDISELEEYFDNFARRHPDLVCCMLRYQPEIGAGLDSPLVRYLTLPVVPVQLGYDPRLQLLHADDATGAIEAAVRRPIRGPVNVAPDGSISLSRILRLCGRPALPLPPPLFGPLIDRFNRRLGAGGLLGDGVRLLRFGRGVDNRRLREELGYEPLFDAVGAVRDLAAKTESRRVGPPLTAGALAGRLTGIGS
jgi:UDP-glucose 4-epimerase